MARKAKGQDVQWYERGKQKPFAQSTIAERDFIESLLHIFGSYTNILQAFDNMLYMYNKNEYEIAFYGSRIEQQNKDIINKNN